MTSLVWFRRDLRLTDNPAWAAATTDHSAVEALFVLDQRLLSDAGSLRRDLLFAHLGALDGELRRLGGSLRVETGNPETIVPIIAADHDAAYWNRSYTPFSARRDAKVAAAMGPPIEAFDGDVVHAPGTVLTGGGTPYRVFTPYYRRWNQTPIERSPRVGPATVVGRGRNQTPVAETPIMLAGEAGARERLERFLETVDTYEEDRDRPDLDQTSHLSADLKFGTISARTLTERVGRSTSGRRAFVRQLAWRDFYAQVLFHSPRTIDHAYREDLDSIVWADDEEAAAAWKGGQTGYPIVDAGMRQLRLEGWMHGRVRMIAASFLVKDLGVDWRIGEQHFRRLLVDADPAQNVGNWQWVAGTGADAAPYFRIMNPITQSRRFDPDGAYIRRYVPELAPLDGPGIHAPWERPLETAAAGVDLGTDYPYPMVDHSEAREITLRRFGAARA
ncbi:MAG: deoxyribodipyrimidine photo-lyase [Acidimicrobiia bacterium]